MLSNLRNRGPGNAASRIFPLLLVNFIGALGFSIVLPFLVFLVNKFGGNGLIYGILGATYPALQFFGAPLLGRWSDVYGRKKVLLLSHGGTLLSWGLFLAALLIPMSGLFAVQDSFLGTFTVTVPLLVLFLARGLDGLTGGNISVANAYLADITDEENRGAGFGKMAVASNLGFILGPTIAGLLGSTVYGELLPVLAAIGVSLLAGLTIWFYLPESNPCALSRSPEAVTVKKVLGQEQKDCLPDSDQNSVRKVLSLPDIPYLLLIYFLIFFGFSLFYSAFPVHASTGLGWSVKELGVFFALIGAVMALVQGPLLSRLSKRFSDSALIIAGGIILGGNFLLLTVPRLAVVYLAGVLFSLGNGLMWPSFLSYLSRKAGGRHQGAVQGTAGSAGSLAGIAGLIAGGVLYDNFGGRTFLLSAAVIFLCVILALRLPAMAGKVPSKDR